ncbi:MAG: sigma 54-interacting transcriptional regulator [Myxococcota bacterium]
MTTLVTWSDRGAVVTPDHHGPRPAADQGPVVRLLDASEVRYERLVVLVPSGGMPGARRLADDARTRVGRVDLRPVDVTDPSDYPQLFAAVSGVVDGLRGTGPLDLVLSAGTPQAQTIWVILVSAGLVDARMLQVIPARFVPDPHPHPIRQVRLPIDGFPEIRALREEVVRLRAGEVARAEAIGGSAPMTAVRARIARVAPTAVPVVIHGETGTGKELVARAIHRGSARSDAPFVACNAGAVDDGLLASELFGHEAGAFTGAVGRRRGLFELAHGGTLFLDEVGELSARVQVGLLRVLQEGELRRVGGEEVVRVDVRVVAATHRDLRAAVRAGSFREDLWYRLAGAALEVPPLRDRPEDLPALVERFLDDCGRPGLPVSPAAWHAVVGYRWPGNVRELRAEVVRWSVFAGDRVERADLSPEVAGAASTRGSPSEGVTTDAAGLTLAAAVSAAEQRAIATAWASNRGNVAATARALGIDRNTLKRKLRAYRLR